MRSIFLITAPMVLVLLMSPIVSAQSAAMDEQRIERIRSNCIPSMLTMQRVQISDKGTRINRGYVYESILKHIAALNNRAAYNSHDTGDLVRITSALGQEFDRFKSTYTTYDTDMNNLLKMDCQAQPVTFYDKFDQVRQRRKSLNGHINAMEAVLDDYQHQVDKLRGVDGESQR